MNTPAPMTDLRHITTGAKLTRAERNEAQLRHLVASNEAQHRAVVADLARRDIKPRVAIGSGYVPNRVTRAFAYAAVGGLR
ncbi:hypothetical protein [Cupriavidus campinensis]|uniref:Uncharacterized protein n=1 Tax=Cupriavidus campinensis TaxID=151783 RepID=A0ABY3EKQ7_9BURK|nr:hypothetical protein [Cupriavidus campinensis]TSP11465.1 hypothetical protein FGG12_17670 [Cupriavidus campinensis]